MKKLLSKLFSYLPIMNSVMLSSYRNLKRGNKNAWEFVFYSGCLLGVVMFFIIVELSKQLLLKFL